MDAELVADFHCHEGWSRLGEPWRGVRLETLLALAGASDAGRYVTVGSGEYTVVLTREQAKDERVLLALEHEGAASPRPAGFPRLVGPSEWDCFLSVKSVGRIELTREPARATASTIALAARPDFDHRPGAHCDRRRRGGGDRGLLFTRVRAGARSSCGGSGARWLVFRAARVQRAAKGGELGGFERLFDAPKQRSFLVAHVVLQQLA
jgi:DMSO/TMAO reductase YedYZ molybdopterin-dependent catalytic subunit